MPKSFFYMAAWLIFSIWGCASGKKTIGKDFQIKFVSTTSGLNIRSEPSTSSPILTVAPFDAEIQVFKSDKTDPSWPMVKYGSYDGFASSAFLVDKSAAEGTYLSVYAEFFDKETCTCNFHYYDRAYEVIDLRRPDNPKYMTQIIDEARIFIYNVKIKESTKGVIHMTAIQGKEYKLQGQNFHQATLGSYKYVGPATHKIKGSFRRQKCTTKNKTLDFLISNDGNAESDIYVLYNQCNNRTGRQIIIPD